MLHIFEDLLATINIQDVDYATFRKQLSILDISDTTGTFSVRSDLDTFFNRVANKEEDNRKELTEAYCEKMYQILVTDAKASLRQFYKRYGELTHTVDFYLDLPVGNCYNAKENTYYGMTHSKYGRLCKNINFDDFYNTKKLYTNDSEYVFGLIKVMYEQFHIRNSLCCPAFFDHIINTEDDYNQFWLDFWMGANKASIFNPYTFKSILDTQFSGKTLFTPCMGWNGYQIGFYNSQFEHLITTDVIPNVVANAHKLHTTYKRWRDTDMFQKHFIDEKTIDAYLCPSEQLESRHKFIETYTHQVDAVLFCPPYFDLELYPGDEQSTNSFPDYKQWLNGYWEETIKLCAKVMKPGAKFGFIISNYRTHEKQDNTISEDMKALVEKHLTYTHHCKVRWSSLGGSRQAHKQRDGNYENLWMFEN
jgi:hypothetical protein